MGREISEFASTRNNLKELEDLWKAIIENQEKKGVQEKLECMDSENRNVGYGGDMTESVAFGLPPQNS